MNHGGYFNEVEVKLLSRIRLSATPWTVAYHTRGIFQARVLEWVAISFSRGSSRLRDRTQVSSIVGRRFYRLSHQGSHSAIRVISPAYLRLLMFLPEILIPACDSSSLAFHMMYSAYKLNKQGDSIQP